MPAKPRLDLIGRRFNRFTVVGYVPYKGWLCRCDCGNEKIHKAATLRRQNSKSCGCLNKELARIHCAEIAIARRTYVNSNQRGIYLRYKANARNRNIHFDISDVDFYILCAKGCYYCGILNGNRSFCSRYSSAQYTYNGLDRVDSSRGYMLDNVVPCCSVCNYAKKSMTQTDFYKWIARVSTYSKEKLENVKI